LFLQKDGAGQDCSPGQMEQFDTPKELFVDRDRMMFRAAGKFIRYRQNRVDGVFSGKPQISFDLLSAKRAISNLRFDQHGPTTFARYNLNKPIRSIGLPRNVI
tara:strand:+ start:76808 stop:77116 length:309 start_codon:yes stop_codon:yes gene_type:complete